MGISDAAFILMKYQPLDSLKQWLFQLLVPKYSLWNLLFLHQRNEKSEYWFIVHTSTKHYNGD